MSVPDRALWADGEMAVIRTEMARADGKCGVLTGVATGAAAFAASQAAGHGPLAVRVADAAAGVVFAAGLLVLLTVLRPRLGDRGWCRWAVTDLARADLRSLATGHVVRPDVLGRSPHGLSISAADLALEDLPVFARLAAAKFRRVRIAVDLVSAGAVLLAAAIVTGVIA